MIGTINIVGRYLGPWLAGMLIDATGVVGNSFGIVGVTMLVAAVIAFTFPRFARRRRKKKPRGSSSCAARRSDWA